MPIPLTRIPLTRIPLTRRNLYKRDKGICQLCKKKVSFDEMSFMHIVPRSEGGRTEWLNLITAHVACNKRERENGEYRETERILNKGW